MHFRCPNCQQPILLEDQSILTDPNGIECPSCHSRFSLSDDLSTKEAFPTGKTIGHFELVSILGEGGFGVVYRAWDTELNRHVALKTPREGREYRDSTKFFLKEARAAAAIHHPNVVSVYEVGVHSGQPYIASQLIDGVSLSDLRRMRSLDFKFIARLMIKILRAIHAFHEHGLVHRDLKPANILIDANDEPYVTDFGLAKSLTPDAVTVTADGRVIGTLHYMSPEQAAGHSSLVSPRSDVYACGVILFELLTGKRPFQATSSRTLLYQILHTEPPLARRINSQIPVDLQTICQKAMAGVATERYTSASEFADDLQRYLDHRPIAARPVSRLRTATRFVRRNRAATIAACVATLGLFTAMSAFIFRGKPPLGVPVTITTIPPADEIVFVRYDEFLRIPHRSGFQAVGGSGDQFDLFPGLYKVVASNLAGKTHEVWRNVPEASVQLSATTRYPHLDFQRREDGTAELPSFRLFSDQEVVDSLVLAKEGEFEMGFQANYGEHAAKHMQVVNSFFVGVNEVSWGQFRRVMSSPHHRQRERSYLEVIDEAFGDRSGEPENRPVQGYPPDVALLYAELAGGRLPTNAEYEFVATQGGNAEFPSGIEAAITTEQPWEILAVDQPTPDTSPAGVRNLFASVAEFTDSSTVAYLQQYPDAFQSSAPEHLTASVTMPDELRAQLARQREIRGAPSSWILTGANAPNRNVRQRISLPPITIAESEASTFYARIGWRIYRTYRD